MTSPSQSSSGTPVVVMGPTASGKTELALALARALGGEIVSADSRQVYRRLDAGTAKPEGAWKGGVFLADGVPYHLVDFVDPARTFSAAEFARLAAEAAERTRTAGRRLIMAGGTGLYVEAFWNGLDPLPPRDADVRARLAREMERRGPKGLLADLSARDPEAASRIGPNPQRLLRALEVLELTGRPISEQWTKKRGLPCERARFIVLDPPAEALAARIEARARGMFPAMVTEARGLIELGYGESDPGLQSLGYPEALACARGRMSEGEGLRLLITRTRQYAKRQRTWFRRYDDPRVLRLASWDAGRLAAALKAGD